MAKPGIRHPKRALKRRNLFARTLGQAPGQLQHLGDVRMAHASITLFDYDATQIHEERFASIEQSRDYTRQHQRMWLNVHGLHDTAVMQEIGRRFNLHPLVLEDIGNTQQRPKIDDYGDYLFIVLRAFRYDESTNDASSDQISIVLGRDFLLSFQEQPSGMFEPVRERLRRNAESLRNCGSDALLHALIDAVVDPYFVVVEALGSDVENLEDQLLAGSPPNTIGQITHFKREALEIKRAIWPTREVVNTLLRHTSWLSPETQLYLRDVYDHTVHIIEVLDALRDLIGDLLSLHQSTISNRLNSEVRVLTVVTTLFAPATVVTGFFGMNFQQLPLLDRPHGWQVAMVMVVTTCLALAGMFGWRYWRKRG